MNRQHYELLISRRLLSGMSASPVGNGSAGFQLLFRRRAGERHRQQNYAFLLLFHDRQACGRTSTSIAWSLDGQCWLRHRHDTSGRSAE